MHDVVIVGGGPAGAVAALITARAGLSVALVDRHIDRPASRRTETVSFGPRQGLRQLGISDRLRHVEAFGVQAFVSAWGRVGNDRRGSMLWPDGTQVVIDRTSLDRVLREAAADAGASVIFGQVGKVQWREDCWRVFCGESHFFTRVLVDASGRESRIARSAGAKLLSVDKLVAHTAVLAPESDDTDRGICVEAGPDGWLFTTQHPTGWRMVSYFHDGGRSDQSYCAAGDRLQCAVADGSDRFRRFGNRLAGQPVEVQSATTQVLDEAVLGRLIVIGDAAQTYDPLSSQGVSAAVDDSISATEALVTAFDGDFTALRGHERGRRLRFLRYLKRRQDYYALEQRWAQHSFWRRRHSEDSMRRAIAHWFSNCSLPSMAQRPASTSVGDLFARDV